MRPDDLMISKVAARPEDGLSFLNASIDLR